MQGWDSSCWGSQLEQTGGRGPASGDVAAVEPASRRREGRRAVRRPPRGQPAACHLCRENKVPPMFGLAQRSWSWSLTATLLLSSHSAHNIRAPRSRHPRERGGRRLRSSCTSLGKGTRRGDAWTPPDGVWISAAQRRPLSAALRLATRLALGALGLAIWVTAVEVGADRSLETRNRKALTVQAVAIMGEAFCGESRSA